MSNGERIEAVVPPYDADIAAELERWMPPGAPVEALRLFRTLVRHPELAMAMRACGSFLLGKGMALGVREREIIIDRTCARCACEYEWGVHVTAFAGNAGLSAREVAATTEPATGSEADTPWSARERLLIRAVDELHESTRISEPLWRQLSRELDTKEQLELFVLAGWYHLISFIANGAALAPEPWAAAFPE